MNLFRVFEANMQQRSVSGAGRELGVTASAVSHALSRLRTLIGDELFVAGPAGMEPTPCALDLAPNISEGIGRIRAALDRKGFSPIRSTRSFTIAASDYSSLTIIPPLVERLARSAPQASLRVFPIGRMDVVRQLDNARIDLVLGWFQGLPDRLRHRLVLVEEEALVVRAGHRLAAGVTSKQLLLAFPHVVVELTGSEDRGLDGFLDDRGLMRRTWNERLLIDTANEDDGLIGRVAVTVPTYSAVAPILRRTDMIATLPRRLALQAIRDGSLVLLELPYQPLKVSISVAWHQRSDQDQALQWLVNQMIDTNRAAERDR